MATLLPESQKLNETEKDTGGMPVLLGGVGSFCSGST